MDSPIAPQAPGRGTVRAAWSKAWPLHPPPLPDEILSSWLTRLAKANRIKLHTLVSLAFPQAQVWNRDIDRSATISFLCHLAARTRQPYRTVRDTTLPPLASALCSPVIADGNSKWLLPAGVYHRTRRDAWMAYCPLCLATDPIPYFRRKWRLAFYTLCDLHGVLLLDRCPWCGEVVQYFRRELGHRYTAVTDELYLCCRCGYDLRRAAAYGDGCSSWKVLSDLKMLCALSEAGFYGGQVGGFNYMGQYLSVLHQLIKVLMSRHGQRLRECLLQDEWCPIREKIRSSDRRATFELLPIEQRHLYLCMALSLLQDWPRRLLSACEHARVRSSLMFRDWRDAPFWFESVVLPPLYKPDRFISPEEVESAISFCLGHGIPINFASLERLLGGHSRNITSAILRRN